MAIRINAGAAPQYGRITLPRGTFLSNPATAADGSLGGPQGMNPSQIPTPGNMWQGVTPGYNQQLTSDVGSGFGVPSNPFAQYEYKPPKGSLLLPPDQAALLMSPGKAEAYRNLWNLAALGGPTGEQTNAFDPPETPQTPLVGRDIQASPTYLPQSLVSSIYPGATGVEKSALLQAAGYQKVYQAGIGPVWVKVGQPSGVEGVLNGAVSAETDTRGRPVYVDPTRLERGERVTASSGVTFVGGLPHEDAQGNVVAQYAMTLPGGQDNDRYKWKSVVRKDKDGNWVRIYSRELRKVYTRSHRKKLIKRREEQAMTDTSPHEINQLVNLRADYG